MNTKSLIQHVVGYIAAQLITATVAYAIVQVTKSTTKSTTKYGIFTEEVQPVTRRVSTWEWNSRAEAEAAIKELQPEFSDKYFIAEL